jgi:hypothetical protein
MAQIQKRTYKSRNTGTVTTSWQARYTAPDGRERTKRFERKIDAENWVKSNEGDIVRGAWVDPKAGQVHAPFLRRALAGTTAGPPCDDEGKVPPSFGPPHSPRPR